MKIPYTLTAACLVGAVAWPAPAESRTVEQRPNILVLYADDLGYGDLSLLNPDSRIPTPHLDRLAEEGLRFTDAHSSSGICTPSRYALLTGRYHWRKFHNIASAFGPSKFAAERLTLPEMLREKGYHTAAIGKWHLGWDWEAIRNPGVPPAEGHFWMPERPDAFDWTQPVPDGPLDHGFDHYFGDDVINFPPFAWIEDNRLTSIPDRLIPRDAWIGEGYPPLDPDVLVEPQSWRPVKEERWATRPGPMVPGWDPYAVLPTLADRAEAYIRRQAATPDPFFLYFALPSPHTPIIPNDPYDGISGAGAYGDFVVQSDAVCGQLLRALEESGQAGNTIVVFTSDNGAEKHAYERDLQQDHWSSAPFRGVKRDLYEGGHHVPFFIRWPGITDPGTISHALVSQIDLMATFASLLGYPLPDDQAEDSHNLMPLLRGLSATVRDTHVHNTWPGEYAIRHGDWLLVDAEDGYAQEPPEEWEVRQAYPSDEDTGVELYNLAGDIGQRNNLAAAHPERVETMQRLLRTIRERGYSAPRLTRDDPILEAGAAAAGLQEMKLPRTADPEALPQVRRILAYLYELMERDTGKLLSGQFLGWYPKVPMEPAERIHEISGEWPAIIGVDYYETLLFDERLTEPLRNKPPRWQAVNRLIRDYWHKGGLAALSLHMTNPMTGGKSWDTSARASWAMLDPATPEGAAYQRQLGQIADGLQDLQEEGIVVLFRPFHEWHGGWFWWGQPEPEFARALWHHLFHYLTRERGLHNLVWTYNSVMDRYPGDDYVDLNSGDYYKSSPLAAAADYAEMEPTGKPFAIAEFGPPGDSLDPDSPRNHDYAPFAREALQAGSGIVYFLAWRDAWGMHRNPGTRELLNDPLVLNRDDLRRELFAGFPGWTGAREEPDLTGRRLDGYRGIWFELGTPNAYGPKYSGGLGTYTAKHVPLAVHAPEAQKTFFVYGGTPAGHERHLLAMAGSYDHRTQTVSRPVVVHDKAGVDDPHDNPVIQMSEDGRLWVFVSGRGQRRPGHVYRSRRPHDIRSFEHQSAYEFTYPQPWWIRDAGFLFLFTRYTDGRELYWQTSDAEGRGWSEVRKLAGMGGHYQTSNARDGHVITAFNMHPEGDVDRRTNLYFLMTDDRGRTWRTADGTAIEPPLTDPQGPGLVRDYRAEGKRVYLKDIQFDAEGHPVILHITSHGYASGPESGPRKWMLAHWRQGEWRFHEVADAWHNYDMGSLDIGEDGTWRIFAPTEPGPQEWGTGGEVAIWTSADRGRSWTRQTILTRDSPRNHTYVRRPVNAHPDFAAFWADGNPLEMSESHLYFTDLEGRTVYRLPYHMEGAFAVPEKEE